MLLSVTGLSNCASSTAQVNAPPEKALVVYFSWGGNTRTVANEIAEITGSEVLELQLATPYIRDRDEIEEVAKREGSRRSAAEAESPARKPGAIRCD